MCIYMGVRNFGPFIYRNQKIVPFIYFCFKKVGVYHIPGGAEKARGPSPEANCFNCHKSDMTYIGAKRETIVKYNFFPLISKK